MHFNVCKLGDRNRSLKIQPVQKLLMNIFNKILLLHQRGVRSVVKEFVGARILKRLKFAIVTRFITEFTVED